MNKKKWILLGLFALIIAILIGGGFFMKHRYDTFLKEKQAFIAKEKKAVAEASQNEIQAKEALEKTQSSLTELSRSLKRNLQAEQKLSMTMVSQLQVFESLLGDLKTFSQNVENNVAILNRISDTQFQEDVRLQAALYKGKKASIVADHLSEFHANRAGAILANMKEKEASDVLDVWAISNDPKTSQFYKEVMASYLDNKRYLQDPKFYNALKEQEKPLDSTAFTPSNNEQTQ